MNRQPRNTGSKNRSKKVAAIVASAAVVLALAACGSDGSDGADEGSAGAADAGSFSYTDARGETVELDSIPKKVVAQSSVAAALWDAGYKVAGVYGELAVDDYQTGNLELDKLQQFGQTWGEFDVEDYGLFAPDLLIDYTFDAKTLWYVPTEQADQILGLAPSIGVNGNYKNTDEAIETFVDLAAKLGADPKSDALAADKKAYDAALADVAEVAASSGLKVVVMSPGADSLYVANPAYLPELMTLRGKGLDLMDPNGGDPNVFHQFSWEQASDYAAADVILVDARTYDSEKEALGKIATWTALPAVAAGQVYPWKAAAPYSYAAYAEIYQEIADNLRAAKKLS